MILPSAADVEPELDSPNMSAAAGLPVLDEGFDQSVWNNLAQFMLAWP
jgi:hypothetical protein